MKPVTTAFTTTYVPHDTTESVRPRDQLDRPETRYTVGRQLLDHLTLFVGHDLFNLEVRTQAVTVRVMGTAVVAPGLAT